MNAALRVAVEVAGRDVVVTVANDASDGVRVWSRANSWGWSTFTLVAARADETGSPAVLRAPPQRFTRDGPGVVEIGSGDEHRFSLRPADDGWLAYGGIDGLHAAELRLRAVLTIPASPEADELGVPVGRWESPAVRTDPPHGWLPAPG